MESFKVTIESNDDQPRAPFPSGFLEATSSPNPPWANRDLYPPGTVREIWHHPRHGIHRDHGPALRVFYPETGYVALEEWYREGKLHRVGAPARIAIDPSTGRREQAWLIDGSEHRDDGPSRRVFHPLNDQVLREQWKRHGRVHRADGPAVTIVDQQTLVKTEEQWCRAGRLHRVSSPALIRRHPKTGATLYEEWHIAGALHRANGPARVRYGDGGEMIEIGYFRNGEAIDSPSSSFRR